MAVIDYSVPFRAALWPEIAAAAPATLPANGGGGTWRMIQARRTPLDTIVSSHGLPYAVVGIGEGDLSPRAPADEFLYRHRVEIYLVNRGGEDEDALWLLLGAVRMHFEEEIALRNMTVGRCVEVLRPDTTWYLPPAERAISKQLDIACGRVTVLFDLAGVVSS